MGTHMAARHVPRNRMNRLVTAGLDRWSSKTELGLQTALAFELWFYLKRLQKCSLFALFNRFQALRQPASDHQMSQIVRVNVIARQLRHRRQQRAARNKQRVVFLRQPPQHAFAFAERVAHILPRNIPAPKRRNDGHTRFGPYGAKRLQTGRRVLVFLTQSFVPYATVITSGS